MEATYFDNERSGLYRRRSAGSVELDEEVQEIVLHPSPLPYQDKKVSYIQRGPKFFTEVRKVWRYILLFLE